MSLCSLIFELDMVIFVFAAQDAKKYLIKILSSYVLTSYTVLVFPALLQKNKKISFFIFNVVGCTTKFLATTDQ